MKKITLTTDAIHQGDLILVNPAHGLKAETQERLIPILESAPSVLLQERAAQALERLMAAIDGWQGIAPVSGWRSFQEQNQIWDSTVRESGLEFTKKYVAVPGHSEHQTGLAIDLGLRQEHIDFICPDFPDIGICQTFREQAAAHGFILRYPAGKETVTGIAHEPWHFRYVGVPHATFMARAGLTLEEYLCLLRQYPYGGPPLETWEAEKEYRIHHIKAPAGITLELSETKGHSVSGDNVDGFILTEWRKSDAQ
ncbi:MAG: M15 family metallopeptidase [Lachnospiraceae bacterium]|uniref:M15 family metallopeptidase n=1 Tax=uncultured Acetatifactor sp. TaxID=1671927 RepID=UPI00261E463B|nr:M15 family metallopeptidase [uncultured Acetatifactor sp.]MCI8788150.1 M15 family metallopeptidase [Lachnospiraceae bacterium]